MPPSCYFSSLAAFLLSSLRKAQKLRKRKSLADAQTQVECSFGWSGEQPRGTQSMINNISASSRLICGKSEKNISLESWLLQQIGKQLITLPMGPWTHTKLHKRPASWGIQISIQANFPAGCSRKLLSAEGEIKISSHGLQLFDFPTSFRYDVTLIFANSLHPRNRSQRDATSQHLYFIKRMKF